MEELRLFLLFPPDIYNSTLITYASLIDKLLLELDIVFFTDTYV